MGCGGSKSGPEVMQLNGANGFITPGSRVKTCYTVEEGEQQLLVYTLVLTQILSCTGGDGGWYNGTVKKCYQNGDCSVRYDDGDS